VPQVELPNTMNAGWRRWWLLKAKPRVKGRCDVYSVAVLWGLNPPDASERQSGPRFTFSKGIEVAGPLARVARTKLVHQRKIPKPPLKVQVLLLEGEPKV